MKKYLPLALAGLVGATMVAPSIAGATTTRNVAYDSTPGQGHRQRAVAWAPRPRLQRGRQRGDPAPALRTIGHVKVTMVSFACQCGNWASGCTTTPGATFKAPITLSLYRYSKSNATTGEIKPRRLITQITKTFSSATGPRPSRHGESRLHGQGRRTAQRDRTDDLLPGQPQPRQRRRVDGRLRHEHQRAAPAGRTPRPIERA